MMVFSLRVLNIKYQLTNLKQHKYFNAELAPISVPAPVKESFIRHRRIQHLASPPGMACDEPFGPELTAEGLS
jgi:hypothetical protein